MVSRLTIPNRESLLFEGEGEVGIITLKFVTVISLEGKQGDAYKSSIALWASTLYFYIYLNFSNHWNVNYFTFTNKILIYYYYADFVLN